MTAAGPLGTSPARELARFGASGFYGLRFETSFLRTMIGPGGYGAKPEGQHRDGARAGPATSLVAGFVAKMEASHCLFWCFSLFFAPLFLLGRFLL